MGRLAVLPSLESLWLEGNHLAAARGRYRVAPLAAPHGSYQTHVLSYFPRPALLRLEGRRPAPRTVQAAVRLARQRRSSQRQFYHLKALRLLGLGFRVLGCRASRFLGLGFRVLGCYKEL